MRRNLIPAVGASGLQLFPRCEREAFAESVDKRRLPEIPCIQPLAADILKLGVELIAVLPVDEGERDDPVTQRDLG